MLSLLPVFLLLLSAIVIQVVGRVTKRAGSTWWLATIFSSITWLSLILVGLLDPPELCDQRLVACSLSFYNYHF